MTVLTESADSRLAPSASLLGLDVLALTEAEWIQLIRKRVVAGKGAWIVTLNLEMVSRISMDRAYRDALSKADLVTADGMPIVWASKRKRNCSPIPERVTGSDLTGKLLVEVPEAVVGVIGGDQPTVAIRSMAPEAKIGYVNDERIVVDEETLDRLAKDVEEAGVNLLYIALGVPKQDYIACGLRERLPNVVLLGVGGTFDMMAGKKKRAPLWMQNAGLEWLFRLGLEPKRLWRRYLVTYWVGGFALLIDCLRPGRA